MSFDLSHSQAAARLFPLPEFVLLPMWVQPLHVFENRYRRLVEDALSDDRLLAMAVLAPGWENDYENRPPILPFVCLAYIAQWERLPDGRSHWAM